MGFIYRIRLSKNRAGFIASIVTILLFSVPLSWVVPAQAANPEDDLLLTIVPAIVAATQTSQVTLPPEWTVFNGVCCATSSATFRVTQGSDSRSSVSPSCSVESNLPDFITSTAGTKTFNALLSSSGCGDVPNTFQFAFEEQKFYIFEIDFENGGLVLNVLTGDILSQKNKSDGKNLIDMDSLERHEPIFLETDSTKAKEGQTSYTSPSL